MGNESFTKSVKRDFKYQIRKEIKETEAEKAKREIQELVYKKGRRYGLSLEMTKTLALEIYDQMFGHDIIQKYLDDSLVNEIMVNGLEPIIIERAGSMVITEERFETEDDLLHVIQLIVSKVNRSVNMASPIVDARLEDGSRVNVVLPPISLIGPVLTIRKFQNELIDMLKLVEYETLTYEAALFLERLVKAKYNIFISGSTSSGKTTFLNALSEFIQDDERIITIEDSAELSLKNKVNLVSLETRQASQKHSVTIGDLIITSLRMRPDRIVIGEVRGQEALEMLNAMNTGHDGSLSTGHSNSTKDMLSRLEVMVLKGMIMPIEVIRRMICSSIEIMIHLEKQAGGQRKVSEIVELGENGQMNTLFKLDEKLVKVGELHDKEKLKKHFSSSITHHYKFINESDFL